MSGLDSREAPQGQKGDWGRGDKFQSFNRLEDSLDAARKYQQCLEGRHEGGRSAPRLNAADGQLDTQERRYRGTRAGQARTLRRGGAWRAAEDDQAAA